MLLHRQYSRDCLSQWLDLFANGLYVRDQLALDHAIGNSTNCRPAALDAREWLTYPNITNYNTIWRDLDVGRVFVHVTRTYRLRMMRLAGLVLSQALRVPPALADRFKAPRPPGAPTTIWHRPSSATAAAATGDHAGVDTDGGLGRGEEASG